MTIPTPMSLHGFIATPPQLTVTGRQTEAREEFVARRIGHDLARTRYQVNRTPAHQPDPPSPDLPVGTNEPAPVVGL